MNIVNLWEKVQPEPTSAGERAWGEEIILAIDSGQLMMKKLLVKAGCKGGLQYHRKRSEMGYIVYGKLIIRIGDGEKIEEKIFVAGDHYWFPPGVTHQEEAVEDTLIIECSTPWMNDRVRVEADYNLDDTTGLPTTTSGEEVLL